MADPKMTARRRCSSVSAVTTANAAMGRLLEARTANGDLIAVAQKALLDELIIHSDAVLAIEVDETDATVDLDDLAVLA